MPHKVPPIITPDTAKTLLEGKTRVSLDLGLTETTVNPTKTGWPLPGGETVDGETLRKISEKENSAYFVESGDVFQVAVAGKHFYKLVPTGRAPTLEIDGVRMHRTSGTSPDQDTGTKLDVLELDGGRVLDTCMGLGYTAIESARRGAELVVTVELEPQVVRIALMNPWSAPLFTGEAIHKVIGDTYMVASVLPESFFDYVIHDPPRHDHAGHLYGLDYYRRLHRLMAPGGRMFHYTGEPRSRYRGVNLQRGVSKRLREAGFTGTRYHPEVMGVTCVR
ncbi:MAG TPA: RsmD family RNA methyltransferase [Candidatus Desulfaltia sp.]|nr:RsmD family RNA methyltransferase [Candidatus Desulfaltia sp.]